MSSPYGIRYVMKDTHRKLRTDELKKELKDLQACGIVGESSPDPPTVSGGRSFTTNERMMKKNDEREVVVRRKELIADLSSLMDEETEDKTPTMNKQLMSQESKSDLKAVPSLRSSDYIYNGPTVTNSEYVYFPPMHRNSDYVYKPLTRTNSSYCYSKPGGSSNFAKSSYNPYAQTSSDYQMVPYPVFSSAQLISSCIFDKEYKLHKVTTIEELRCLDVSFTKKCLGTDEIFRNSMKHTSTEDFGLQCLRDYSRQSLEDLLHLPSLSSYTFDQPTEGVQTACSISNYNCSITQHDVLHYFPEVRR